MQREQLQWWWCRQYNRPLKDPLLQEYTLEELQIEYFMFRIDEDPMWAFPRNSMENAFVLTGDPLLDSWEKQLAEGKNPKDIDFDADVDPGFLERLKRYSKRVASRFTGAPTVPAQAAKPQDSEPPVDVSDLFEGFDDNYKG